MESKISNVFSLNDAMNEASRCLNCKQPSCMSGCPAHVNIPKFISRIADMKFSDAYKIITESNVFPEITSRVCYKCNQCEGNCILGKKGKAIQIGKLEECVSDYINDRDMFNEMIQIVENKKINVAIVGAGVAGLAASIVLAKSGCNVTIYEKENDIGGVVRYQIPNIRFDKAILDNIKKNIEKLKIDIIYEKTIGKDIKLIDIKKENDYVILATGAGIPHIIGLDGEVDIIKNELNNIHNNFIYSLNYLRKVNEDSNFKLFGRIIVIGGGNTALDCARTATSGSNDVNVYYRRTEEKMPCRIDELESAKSMGISFKFLITPKKIAMTDDNRIVITFIRTKVVKDENLVEKVVEIENSEFEEIADHLIIATGYEANHDVYSKEILNLQLDRFNNIEVNDKLMVKNNSSMYAVGDLVTGSLTVVNAVNMGMEAARNILSDL